MEKLRKLPIGIENFEKLRKGGFYYVDKTKLIEQLLDQWGEATLFTRPRRFGKSLNMSMLRSFFEIGTDMTLFDGLYISENRALCEEYMGQFPVVSLSLKGVNGSSYEMARMQLIKIINREARRFQFLLESENLTDEDKDVFRELLSKNMDDETLIRSILELTELLELHYNRKVIVLMDEYDVPLAKSNEQGYYQKMVLLIRNLFDNALKTNDSLMFAVLTGCLRVAKESIFTGLNNLKVYSVTNVDFDEFFGFTDAEVKEMLRYYGQDSHYQIVKEWYDGYRFGEADVYCPWDVINYCADHRNSPALPPENYWLNTSGNDVIRHFINHMGEQKKITKTELEQLVNGETIQKEISQELTYKDLYASIDNLWSALFMTGYLTQRGKAVGKRYNLIIPNREIRNIITEHLMLLFKETVESDGETVERFCTALLEGRPDAVEKIFSEYMGRTISVRDTFVRKPTKENFYHGMLLGILGYKGGWTVKSNQESGNGFSDIIVRIDDADTGIVIEVKYAESGSEETECRKALKQINDNRYAAELHQAGIHSILKYAIACNRKRCRVLMEKE